MGKRKRNIFFTSDWHIGHQNILKFCDRKCDNLDQMHKKLINGYNTMVRPEDVCYFIGDMGLCSSGVMLGIIEKLNGTKVLFLGNHDKGSDTMGGLGFDCVLTSGELIIAQERVTISHCPLRKTFREDTTGMNNVKDGEGWHGETRHDRFSLDNRGQFHIHGHIHSPNSGRSKRIEGRQIDVGVDANDYKPVSISQIESFIVRVKREEE